MFFAPVVCIVDTGVAAFEIKLKYTLIVVVVRSWSLAITSDIPKMIEWNLS
jgi:hypothetical protein